MIIAMVFIMATILIETTLYIIKQDREDKVRAWKVKEKKRTAQQKSNQRMTTHTFDLRKKKDEVGGDGELNEKPKTE
jgi:hypothetical protein